MLEADVQIMRLKEQNAARHTPLDKYTDKGGRGRRIDCVKFTSKI